MSRISTLITEEVAKAAAICLKKLGPNGAISRKLGAICAARKYGITEVAKVYDISRTTLTEWIKNFAANSTAGLIAKPKKPRSYVNSEQQVIVKSWMERDHSISIKAVKAKIEKEFDIVLCKSSVHNLMRKLGFSYITPRPKHYKQDESKLVEFKKNLVEKVKQEPQKEGFFFDEARFGTHSNVGYGWFRTGIRSTVKAKIGYKNFYLYGAANPASDEHFELILPAVNTSCMNIYLEEFAKILGDRKVIVIMDGAG